MSEEKPSILYLEDLPEYIDFTIKRLQQDYRLTVIRRPERALIELENNPDKFDLLLVDIMFDSGPEPSPQGFDFVRQVRKKYSTIPILFYSVVVSSEEHEQAKILGVDIVAKDVSYKTLKQRIDSYLSRGGE